MIEQSINESDKPQRDEQDFFALREKTNVRPITVVRRRAAQNLKQMQADRFIRRVTFHPLKVFVLKTPFRFE